MPEFDEKYVKGLRDEAAGWRTKYRELEANGLYKDVEVELAKKGIKADPTWVEVKEGQSVEEAVGTLVEKHPHLAPTAAPVVTTPTSEDKPIIRPVVPRVMSAGPPNTETPISPMSERGVEEIKKDPVARSKLRDLYRGLLASSSNQPDHKY